MAVNKVIKSLNSFLLTGFEQEKVEAVDQVSINRFKFMVKFQNTNLLSQ